MRYLITLKQNCPRPLYFSLTASDLSFFFNQCCVYIASDGGRVCRPLVIADKGISRIKEHHMKELLVFNCILSSWLLLDISWTNSACLKDGVRTFDEFLREGLIEYLDVNEENNALVCLTYSLLYSLLLGSTLNSQILTSLFTWLSYFRLLYMKQMLHQKQRILKLNHSPSWVFVLG